MEDAYYVVTRESEGKGVVSRLEDPEQWEVALRPYSKYEKAETGAEAGAKVPQEVVKQKEMGKEGEVDSTSDNQSSIAEKSSSSSDGESSKKSSEAEQSSKKMDGDAVTSVVVGESQGSKTDVQCQSQEET